MIENSAKSSKTKTGTSLAQTLDAVGKSTSASTPSTVVKLDEAKSRYMQRGASPADPWALPESFMGPSWPLFVQRVMNSLQMQMGQRPAPLSRLMLFCFASLSVAAAVKTTVKKQL
jgi:hypothetical protein